jgi:hypothetical protein
LTLRRRIGISSRRDVTLVDAALRKPEVPVVVGHVSGGLDSRCLLGHVLQKRLPLFAGEELEEP